MRRWRPVRWSISGIGLLVWPARTAAAEAQAAAGAVTANTSMTAPGRFLQETYTFLMDELKCTYCCEKEWRACDCIMNCGLLQGRCDYINRPICDKLRECYVRIDDDSPKAYDFAWQCDLMKCMAFCLRDVKICAPVEERFRKGHCLRALDLDLANCDVACDDALPRRRPWLSLLGPAVIATLMGRAMRVECAG
eukprot:CAMPEP_0117548558 /NCGR_PEP_ID=MMETSP0784-20121206/47711_1 /TAXON_ID=39447 /ORGANISM="" /LENGTH=193 /DNA_ID=CAMNT_0005345517 /DNA_START=1 /DNA_END=579 /DNA_ORIENTATION=+